MKTSNCYLNKIEKLENTVNTWTICLECKGQGKKSPELVRKYDSLSDGSWAIWSNNEGTAPIRPKALGFLLELFGSGLVAAMSPLFRIQKIIHMWLLLVAV
jgi:hypothetical protein